MTIIFSETDLYNLYQTDRITWSMYAAYLPDIKKEGKAIIPFEV